MWQWVSDKCYINWERVVWYLWDDSLVLARLPHVSTKIMFKTRLCKVKITSRWLSMMKNQNEAPQICCKVLIKYLEGVELDLKCGTFINNKTVYTWDHMSKRWSDWAELFGMVRTKESAQRFQTLSTSILLTEVVEWEREYVIGR